MAFEATILSKKESPDFDKKLTKLLQLRYSNEKLGKGHFIPLKNRKGESTYEIKISADMVVLILERKNDNYERIIKEIDKGKNIKFKFVELTPFEAVEVRTQKLSKEEWLEVLGAQKVAWIKEFCHHGVVFYAITSHKIPFPVTGVQGLTELAYPTNLSQQDEFLLTMYANKKVSEEKGNNIKHTNDPVFNKNYFLSLKKEATSSALKKIKSLDQIDFSKAIQYIKDHKPPKKTKENKLEKQRTDNYYSWVNVDGIKQKITGYSMDIPGLFIGRKSPNRGKIKKLYTPDDVIINIDKNCIIPLPPSLTDNKNIPRNPGTIPWKRIVNDNTVEFFAKYFDPITGKLKYKYINNESLIAAKKDYLKFEKARKLTFIIDKIRKENNKKLESKNKKEQELAVVLWLIDKAAIRVGGTQKEKTKEAESADVVGATTLRREHIKLLGNDTIFLSFFGKDNVPYENEIKVTPRVYAILKKLITGKSPDAKLFDVNARDINEYLKSFDKSLSAKVFRTYHASKTFEDQLKSKNIDKNSSLEDKLVAYTEANIDVAILCNHKKGLQVNLTDKKDKLVTDIDKTKKDLKAAKKEKNNSAVTRLTKKLARLEARLGLQEYGGEVTCTTSKANYIDPRILVSWSDRMGVPITKIYTKTLQNKYDWAIKTTGSDFEFVASSASQLGLEKKTKKVTFKKETLKLLQGKNIIEKLTTVNSDLSVAMHTCYMCLEQIKKNLSDKEVLEKIKETDEDLAQYLKLYIEATFWTIRTKTGYVVGTVNPTQIEYLLNHGAIKNKIGLYGLNQDQRDIVQKIPRIKLSIK